jgi:hypothetical protein
MKKLAIGLLAGAALAAPFVSAAPAAAATWQFKGNYIEGYKCEEDGRNWLHYEHALDYQCPVNELGGFKLFVLI